MSLQYHLYGNDDGTQNVTVFHEGALHGASSTNPNWDRILQGILEGDTSVVALFNPANAAAERFSKLSERVSVKGGRVYLDGDEVDNALTQQVVRFLDEGVTDWTPLVAFFENVQANPVEHSREQLYDWLNRRDFTITPDGLIVGYKGVQSDGNGGYQSISRGPAIVDGEPVNGNVPNNVGSVVEMERSRVHHDPAMGCSTGLHVGTFEYAKSFSHGTVLEVHVNPRDVVSVPTDCNWAKVRTCRYTVIDTIDVPYPSAVLDYDDPEYDDWYDEDEPENDTGFNVGDRVQDYDGDLATVVQIDPDEAPWSVKIEYDDQATYGSEWMEPRDLIRV